MSEPKPAAFVADPQAAEFFVSESTGFGFDGPNVRFTYARNFTDFSSPPLKTVRVENLRVVMSVDAAKVLAVGLYDFLKSNGYDPSPRPPDSAVQ